MLATKFQTEKPTECPQCGNPLETYIGEPPLGFVRQEVTTLGQQGERNFKALGKVKGQEMMAKAKEEKIAADKQFLREKGLPDNITLPEYNKAQKLASLTPEQKTRYIHTGKLPPGKR
jgi:hypothetical protein